MASALSVLPGGSRQGTESFDEAAGLQSLCKSSIEATTAVTRLAQTGMSPAFCSSFLLSYIRPAPVPGDSNRSGPFWVSLYGASVCFPRHKSGGK